MEAWSSPVRRPAFSYTEIEKAHKDTLTPSLSKRQTRYSASINWSTWCLFKPQLSAKNILMAIVAHGTSQMKTLFNLWVTPTFSRLSSERLRRWTAEQKSSLFAVLALAGISLCFQPSTVSTSSAVYFVLTNLPLKSLFRQFKAVRDLRFFLISRPRKTCSSAWLSSRKALMRLARQRCNNRRKACVDTDS